MVNVDENGSTNKMHVVISCNTSWNLFNFRRGLIAQLLASGNSVTILAPKDDFSVRLHDMGCRFIDFPMDNKGTHIGKDFLLLLKYIKTISSLKPDCILNYTIKPVIYGGMAARILRVPYITTVTGLGTAFLTGLWLTRMVEKLYRISQCSAEKIFFQNRDDRDMFLSRRLVEQDRTGLIAGSGINLEYFKPKPKSPDRSMTFLLIGRLLWDKGIGEYIEAAKKIKETFPETKFQLLGFLGVKNRTAISREEIDAWVSENIVEYLGDSEDVRPYIANADCIVLPSYREGLPRTLLEAASMARPIIATDVPGCRDVIDDGETGFLCRVKDADDLAASIQKMILVTDGQRVKMGMLGRQKVVNTFDEKIVIDKYMQTIQLVRDKKL